MNEATTDYWARTQAVMRRLLALLPERRFAVRLGDGTVLGPTSGLSACFTLHLKRPSALLGILAPPSVLGFGESYLFDDFDIEGDIVAAFGALETLQIRRPPLRELFSLWRQLRYLARVADRPKPVSVDDFAAYRPEGVLYSTERDIKSAQFVYDVSNDFYRLWLDDRMVYSCAIFENPTQSLAAAQLNKLQIAGEALDLSSGERVLDIGCGWGGFIIHAAGAFGADATGITLSQAQADEANARIQKAGIAERCRTQLRHYENVSASPFDKVASIGMFEHVGPARLAGYFAHIHRLLKAGGTLYIQGGVKRYQQRSRPRWLAWPGKGKTAFTQKYAFPDSHLVTVDDVIRTAEQNGFETLWYRSLRPHYPRTLQHWLDRLEENHLHAADLVGETGFRAWRIMLAGYLYLLQVGQLTELQCLFRRT